MELLAMLLVLVFVVILFIPTEEPPPRINFNECQDLHIWLRKPDPYGGHYLQCGVCGKLPMDEIDALDSQDENE